MGKGGGKNSVKLYIYIPAQSVNHALKAMASPNALRGNQPEIKWSALLKSRLFLRRRLVSLQFGVFTRVSTLLRRWDPITKAPPSQSALLDNLQQFIYPSNRGITQNPPSASDCVFLGPDQSEARPVFAHLRPSGAISWPQEYATLCHFLYSNANKYFLTTSIASQWYSTSLIYYSYHNYTMNLTILVNYYHLLLS